MFSDHEPTLFSSKIPLMQQDEAVRYAFNEFVQGNFPEAKSVGDVVTMLGLASCNQFTEVNND